ncbi:hypothetical protein DUNSADRAFT_6686 [Dunaliella salina]|uniref:Uncharacterized protein n=1 Tax=Dunaliella salina TaxID=3046 RepID=A0ABQ7GMV2_DUNSA|nr:hypothetical protein DUNSADRAFT_6686 [Dunaliella salina]|eukprot:KAF5835929.1 hypothetical protein DUNSADRAFT_6686 [Dunaliella salina]
MSTDAAAAFRSTCKRLRDAAVLPDMLKLSLPIFPLPKLASLAVLLSSQTAACMHLSVRLTDGEDNVKTTNVLDLFDCLGSIGDRLYSLDIPCHSIEDLLSMTRRFLPQLQLLVLRLSEESVVEPDFTLTYDVETDFEGEEKDTQNQLHTVVFSVPPGSAPFKFRSWLNLPPLDLSKFSNLQHLVLRGPIVKHHAFDSNGGRPFILRPHAKVTIDPALGGRKRTPWARQLAVFDTFDTMPGSAVPLNREYKEEDHAGREGRKQAFVARVVKRVIEMDDDGGPTEKLQSQAWSNFFPDAAVEGLMRGSGCSERSDFLLGPQQNNAVDFVAQDLLSVLRGAFGGLVMALCEVDCEVW